MFQLQDDIQNLIYEYYNPYYDTYENVLNDLDFIFDMLKEKDDEIDKIFYKEFNISNLFLYIKQFNN